MYPQEILKLILKRIENQNVNEMERIFSIPRCRRCKCREQISITKKRKLSGRSQGKVVLYPDVDNLDSETFMMKYEIKYEKNLSSIAKCLLNSFEKKYIYYAIDDLLYTLKSTPLEREALLSILYTPIISLQNRFSTNFFDIWIDDIYINKVSKSNKFLTNQSLTFEPFSYITIIFRYKMIPLVLKQESLW